MKLPTDMGQGFSWSTWEWCLWEAAFEAKSLLSRLIFLQESVALCPFIQLQRVLLGSKPNFARQIRVRSALQEMFESQIWLR